MNNYNLISTFATSFFVYFSTYLMLPITVAYLHFEFDANFAQIGLILSANMLTAIAIRPFVGFLFSRFPKKLLLLVSLILFIFTFLGYILADSLISFTLFRLLHGLSFSLSIVTLNTLTIDNISSTNREYFLSRYNNLSSIAMALSPMTTLYFFDANQNYDEPFIIAIILCLIGTLLVLFIKEDRKSYSLDRSHLFSLDRFFLMRDSHIALNVLIVAISYGMLTTFCAYFGNNFSKAPSGSGLFFLFFAISMIVSRLLTAQFLNAGHLKAISNTSMSILGLSIIAFVLNANNITFFLSAFFIGATYGMLTPALQNMIFNLAPHNQRGTANATYVVSWDSGVGLGILLGGTIAMLYNLSFSFLFAAVLLIIGQVIFIAWSAPHYTRNKLV